MPDGGTFQISVRRGLTYQTLPSIPAHESGDDWVQVTLSDSGVGMSKEVMQHIFEPLFTTKRTGGIGLGLAVSHQIMSQHAGLILVDSEEGRGSRFHLLLRAANGGQRLAEAGAHVSDRPLRFLLAEDEELVAEGLRILLEDGGHTVEIAANGKAAIEAADRFEPDVMVLDVRLPDIDGTEVFRTVRSRHPALPIIFSTGHADESAVAEYLKMPKVGYILKPYEIEMLIEIAERVVGSE
jgi:two-component system cell cycle sensor histidine kinase/response regulator CckA